MKILLLGSTGQLGKTIMEGKPNFIKLITPNKKELNLKDIKNIKEKIIDINPDWIINCGAFTNVDLAEKEPKEAFLINYLAIREIALSTIAVNAKLIHFSTDYVFDGKTTIPYKPLSERNPINQYGKSKALGEIEIENILDGNNGVIIRTSWLVSHIGENFVKKILNFHQQNKSMKIIDDQSGCLTSTFSLSKACWKTIEILQKNKYIKKGPVKIIHWSSKGITNWYQIALSIGEIGIDLKILNKKSVITPVKSSFFKNVAKRPLFSALDCSESEKFLDLKIPSLEKELFDVINIIKKKI